MSNPPPIDFLTRCAALGRRGLSRDLVHDLQTAGNVEALEQLERATDEALVEVTRIDAERRAVAARVAELQREAALWQDEADQA